MKVRGEGQERQTYLSRIESRLLDLSYGEYCAILRMHVRSANALGAIWDRVSLEFRSAPCPCRHSGKRHMLATVTFATLVTTFSPSICCWLVEYIIATNQRRRHGSTWLTLIAFRCIVNIIE